MADSRGGPLTGIKVLDITRFQVSGLSARADPTSYHNLG